MPNVTWWISSMNFNPLKLCLSYIKSHHRLKWREYGWVKNYEDAWDWRKDVSCILTPWGVERKWKDFDSEQDRKTVTINKGEIMQWTHFTSFDNPYYNQGKVNWNNFLLHFVLTKLTHLILILSHPIAKTEFNCHGLT